MRKVWDEVPFSGLLLSEGIRIDVTELSKIIIECGLSRQLTPVDLFSPKWMLSQMLPRNTLHWIFLEQTAQKIREKGRSIGNRLVRPALDLSDKLLETTGFEGRQARCHLIEDTTQGPDIRLETVNALIVKEFGRHVVRSAIFLFRPVVTTLSIIILRLVFVVCEVG